MGQKKKYVIMFEIYFWAFDAFELLLKRSKILQGFPITR